MNYYISDTHFFHANTLWMCKRPFKTVEQMNESLIENWNKKVTKNDTVYFLGDFGYKTSKDSLIKTIQKLNGNIVFIKGNHDKVNFVEDIQKFPNITVLSASHSPITEVFDSGKRIILSHFPLETWNAEYRGSIHIHGHVHNSTLPYKENRYNVSCEVTNYQPMTLNEILDRGNNGNFN